MQRPISIIIFGLLNLFFALLGLMVAVFAALILNMGAVNPPGTEENLVLKYQQTPLMLTFTSVANAIGGVASVVLFISGVGLLLARAWGRKMSVGYAIYGILAVFVATAMQGAFVALPVFDEPPSPAATSAKVGVVFGMAGNMLGLVYPLLLLYFMTRPRVVVALGGVPTQDDVFDPAARARPESGNPYVSPLASSSPLAGESASDAESVVEAFIPSQNGAALASYYMGLFSLFPVLGFPLGVAAVYYGRRGLRNVRANPAVRGGAHAWVGIVCGSLFGLFNFLLLVVVVIGLIGATMRR